MGRVQGAHTATGRACRIASLLRARSIHRSPSVHHRSQLDHWRWLKPVKPGAISVSLQAAPATSSLDECKTVGFLLW
jgi:hypothetical protein